MHRGGVFSAITPHTSLVIVQLSQAPPIGRNFYKRRGFVLIALALIEQLAVEADETALAVSRGITHQCDQPARPANEGAAMTAARVGEKVCHPVVIIKVNVVKCRALLDTEATGLYISAFLVSPFSNPDTWY